MIDLIHGDSLAVMDSLISQGLKVDAIITDPPYGTTQNKWDTVIPFTEMWKRLKYLRKEKTPIVLFGSEPFSSFLRISNIAEYKYDWVWDKILKTGHLNAKKMPMGQHELVSVFGNGSIHYYPIMEEGAPQHSEGVKRGDNNSSDYGKQNRVYEDKKGNTLKFPSTLSFQKVHPSKCIHPTEKPLSILEYLVKTYTKEGDVVLDFTCGSGSTGVACKRLDRNFIGIDNGICDKTKRRWADIAKERIANS